MSAPERVSQGSRTVSLSALVGRQVRDAQGHAVGRIKEFMAEIELHRHGNDYVVSHVVIGRFGALDETTYGHPVPCAGDRWRRWAGYRRYEIPWQSLDLAEPTRPRILPNRFSDEP